MAYVLAGSNIRNPYDISEHNDTQMAQNRTLSGSITRDYFGSNKRQWRLTYRNTKVVDFTTINAIYLSYLATGTTQTWQVTEANYTVAQTNVHIDLQERGFSVRGQDYISDFDLILTEA